ncbi:MAG: BspA family leucine-rich repeat surface protein, partial [Lachnospiraceae bacterium]|nr:BspA family leucine-rich repeat surface protein [Lachnospiraceae bacterium]
MKSKKMKAFLIATVFAFESIVMGFVPVSAQPVSVSENDMVNQDVEEKNAAEYVVNNDETKKAAEKSEDINAEAATVVYSGIDGDLSWSIDAEGHLTISGTGDYENRDYYRDYYTEELGWLAYKSEILSATVNVSEITDTSYMFYYCNNLISIDLIGLDTSSVTDMYRMFSGCSSLTSLD